MLGWPFSVIGSTAHAQTKPAPDYRGQVAPIFTKYCAGCHNDEDREGNSRSNPSLAAKRNREGPRDPAGRPQGKPDDPRAHRRRQAEHAAQGRTATRSRRDRDHCSLDRSRGPRPAGRRARSPGPDRAQDSLAREGPARSSRSTPRATASGWPSPATAEVALYKMPGQGRGLPDRPERLLGKFPGKVTAAALHARRHRG